MPRSGQSPSLVPFFSFLSLALAFSLSLCPSPSIESKVEESERLDQSGLCWVGLSWGKVAGLGSKNSTMMKARGAGSSPRIIIVRTYTHAYSILSEYLAISVCGYTCLNNAKKHDSPLTRPIEKKVGSDLHFSFAFFCLLAPPIHLSYVNEGNELNFTQS